MISHLRVQMVAPDDGIGTLQVLGGSPSHPVTVGTTQTHDDKSLRPPRGWRVCRVVHTVHHYSFPCVAY